MTINSNTATFSQIGYYFNGVAVINTWDNHIGTVEITPVTIKDQNATNASCKRIEIAQYLNDGGFGAECVLGGEINVYNLYEGGVKVFAFSNRIYLNGVRRIVDDVLDNVEL